MDEQIGGLNCMMWVKNLSLKKNESIDGDSSPFGLLLFR